MFDTDRFITESLQESSDVKSMMLNSCKNDIKKAVDIIIDSLKSGGKIMLCGNGGSAADCQHIATEFVIRLSHDITRPAIAAIALTTDTSLLTAGANDIGYDNVFSRQVEALGKSTDVLIAISTSGNSRNVINAVKMAKEMGVSTIAMLGGSGGLMRGLCDCEVLIPSENVQRIQEGHITAGHIICESVERKLYS
jgi:D-sedoheptulose 7-phosphate isomerase